MNMAQRPYSMTKRSASAMETTNRILAATVSEFWDSPSRDLRLETIATRSGVTVQTILRQFGNKDNLLLEAAKFEGERIQATRDSTCVTSVESAVHQLVLHYEEMGDRVIRMLAEEFSLGSLAQVVHAGRKLHRKWCRDVFAETLNPLPPSERKIRLAQLVAVCDVYTWKILRRDSGLSSQTTEKALVELINSLTKE
jgi:AcrR family transcriptional regulator